MKVETLHKLCGSEASQMKHFKEKLIKALNAVTEASTTHGQLFSYEIIGDLVHVSKKASLTQEKHLATKAKKAIARVAKRI